jgi:hypothetical protein
MHYISLKTTKEIKLSLKRDNLYKTMLQVTDIKKWKPDLSADWFLGVNKDTPIGILIIKSESINAVSIHAGIYPAQRGVGKTLFQEIVNRFHNHKPNIQLCTKIMENNLSAIKCVEAAGFKQTGYIPNAKDGKKMLIYSEIK